MLNCNNVKLYFSSQYYNNYAMKRKTTLFIIISLFLGFVGCKKDVIPVPVIPEPVGQMKEMQVPPTFSWMSYKDATLKINIQSPTSLDKQPIFLYDKNFKLIETSVIEGTKAAFNAKIPLDNDFVTVFIPANRASMVISDFNTGVYNMVVGKSGAKDGGADSVSPGCNSGCNSTVSSTVYSLTVNANQTVCLTGSLNGGLTLKNNSKIIICGSANISYLNFNGSSATIILTSFGSLQMNSLSLGNDNEFYNYSNSCNINGALTTNEKLYNYGSMTMNSLVINSSGSVYNYGNMTIVNSATISKKLKNYGLFTAGGNIVLNSSAEVENNCKMISNQSITVSNDIDNNGYMKATSAFTVNSNQTITMGAASMISTYNFNLNGTISGGASNCAVKVSHTTTINSGGHITGLVNFCDSTGIETNYGTIASSVVYCTGYIPLSSCNPEGIGTPPITDSDGDGIADALDEYPNNSSLAFTNYSPYSGYKVIAFEDLWPSMGDFDFNDLMIKTKVKYRVNAQNKVVDAYATVILSALGAGLHNGIGLQYLNATGTQVSGILASISGASIDQGDNDCVKITNDVFSEQSTYYTNTSTALAATPDTLHFTITFSQANGGFAFNSINEDFYIFRSNNRALEIHCPNRPPTEAASSSYFGTFNDNSNATIGRYYKTVNNLPWGFELIDGSSNFHNPLEKIEIIDAYPLFQQWATSSGAINSAWYASPNPTKIFTSSF